MTETATVPGYNKYAIPMRMGLLIALFNIIMSTVQYTLYSTGIGGSAIITLISIIITFILLVVTGKMQRKEMGGYISLKDAFTAILIVGAIVSILNYAYDRIYVNLIDPDVLDRINESTKSYSIKIGGGSEEAGSEPDRSYEPERQGFSFARELTKIAVSLVAYTALAFIAALIVKRKPEDDQPQQQIL